VIIRLATKSALADAVGELVHRSRTATALAREPRAALDGAATTLTDLIARADTWSDTRIELPMGKRHELAFGPQPARRDRVYTFAA
jgi:hypothetical protein